MFLRILNSLSLDRLGFIEFLSFELGFSDLVGKRKVFTSEDCSEFAHSSRDAFCVQVAHGEGGGSNNPEAKKLSIESAERDWVGFLKFKWRNSCSVRTKILSNFICITLIGTNSLVMKIKEPV